MSIMYRYLSIFIVLLLFNSCAEKTSEPKNSDQKKETKISLVKKWETDTVFTTAESAIYDAKRDIIYVSNIEDGPW